MRDGRAETRGREASLKVMLTDRAASSPAWACINMRPGLSQRRVSSCSRSLHGDCGLNDGSRFLAPILVEFGELGERGHVRHAIQKHFSDQMVYFMLNTHRIESLGLDVDRLAVAI